MVIYLHMAGHITIENVDINLTSQNNWDGTGLNPTIDVKKEKNRIFRGTPKLLAPQAVNLSNIGEYGQLRSSTFLPHFSKGKLDEVAFLKAVTPTKFNQGPLPQLFIAYWEA